MGLRIAASSLRTRPEDRATQRQRLRYSDWDLFLRLGTRTGPDGWAFTLRAGLTIVPDRLPYPGLGFDVDRRWLLGRHALVGGGIGIKGVFGADDDLRLDAVPVMRVTTGLVF